MFRRHRRPPPQLNRVVGPLRRRVDVDGDVEFRERTEGRKLIKKDNRVDGEGITCPHDDVVVVAAVDDDVERREMTEGQKWHKNHNGEGAPH